MTEIARHGDSNVKITMRSGHPGPAAADGGGGRTVQPAMREQTPAPFVVAREKPKWSREPGPFATDFLVGLVPSPFRFHRGRTVPNVQVRSVSNLSNSTHSGYRSLT
jgi:hypothetical protein